MKLNFASVSTGRNVENRKPRFAGAVVLAAGLALLGSPARADEKIRKEDVVAHKDQMGLICFSGKDGKPSVAANFSTDERKVGPSRWKYTQNYIFLRDGLKDSSGEVSIQEVPIEGFKQVVRVSIKVGDKVTTKYLECQSAKSEN